MFETFDAYERVDVIVPRARKQSNRPERAGESEAAASDGAGPPVLALIPHPRNLGPRNDVPQVA
jgi:hypothetical protein